MKENTRAVATATTDWTDPNSIEKMCVCVLEWMCVCAWVNVCACVYVCVHCLFCRWTDEALKRDWCIRIGNSCWETPILLCSVFAPTRMYMNRLWTSPWWSHKTVCVDQYRIQSSSYVMPFVGRNAGHDTLLRSTGIFFPDFSKHASVSTPCKLCSHMISLNSQSFYINSLKRPFFSCGRIEACLLMLWRCEFGPFLSVLLCHRMFCSEGSKHIWA